MFHLKDEFITISLWIFDWFSKIISSSHCFIEVVSIKERIRIARKSIFCNTLNTLRSFNKRAVKIEFLFEIFCISFWDSRFSHSMTFTRRCSFETLRFWELLNNENFNSRFRKILFTVAIKSKKFMFTMNIFLAGFDVFMFLMHFRNSTIYVRKNVCFSTFCRSFLVIREMRRFRVFYFQDQMTCSLRSLVE